MNRIDVRNALRATYREALLIGTPPDSIVLIFTGKGYGSTAVWSTALTASERAEAAAVIAMGKVPLICRGDSVVAIPREWLAAGIGVS